MTLRKVYCELVEALVYESRCLYKLCQVTKDSKTCDCCILRELEKLKATGTKVPNDTNDINDINDTNGIKDINDIGNRSRQKMKKRSAKRRAKKTSRSIESETPKQMYTTEELSEILGKAERTLQEWAQKGRIPAVRVGIKWRFPKEGVDRWLSRRKGDGCGIPHTKQSEELPEPVNSPDSSSSSEDPLFCSIETKKG